MLETVVPLTNRMSEADYEAARQKIRETYGDSKRDAGARYEQELSRLFLRSNWKQQDLAKKEGKAQSWINYRLRLGGFLDFISPEINVQNLSVNGFNTYWSQTDKAERNDRIRFKAVLKLIEADAEQKAAAAEAAEARKQAGEPEPMKVGKALTTQFANGKWHHFDEIEAECPDMTPKQLRDALSNLRKDYTVEKRKHGISHEIRIFKREREVSALELKEKLGPLIKQIEAEGKKNAATLSVPAVALIAAKLRKLLADWSE